MNKNEFLQLCAAYMNQHDRYAYGLKVPEASFHREEESGGVSGGSCWDSSDPQPYDVDIDDPGLGKVLDGFLAKYFPAIPFLQYRTLMGHVVSDSQTDYEYYGNHTDYLVWSLTFEAAWEVLQDAAEALPAELLDEVTDSAAR